MRLGDLRIMRNSGHPHRFCTGMSKLSDSHLWSQLARRKSVSNVTSADASKLGIGTSEVHPLDIESFGFDPDLHARDHISETSLFGRSAERSRPIEVER